MADDTPYARLSAEERRHRSEQQLASGRTDVERWADGANLASGWDRRAELVAQWIAPPARLLDLGCGAMALEKSLAAGVHYQPADVVARDERCLVFDANRGELPAVDADVVTALGVLEYLHDPAGFLAAVRARWSRFILTYHPADIEGAGRDRLAKGWVTALGLDELRVMIVEAGWRIEREEAFKNQRILDLRAA